MSHRVAYDSGTSTQVTCSLRLFKGLTVTALTLSAIVMTPAQADGPGRGATAQFERDYLTFIIDHHYSALRMTELAAGTDVQRDPPVNNPQEGTSPTPGTSATPPKAGMEDVKSMARMGNRMQREEIAKAQKFLREWYGVNHTPTVRPEGQQQIQLLEQAPGGAQFERTFLQVFSNHHYGALHPSLDCQVKADNDHHQLKGYCEGIVHHQIMEVNDMREMLCKQFSICDFQPTTGTATQSATAASVTRQ
ncbi:DUF305 domain-containing protein [Herbaspirillum sp. GCM10030257]|uniref:DUF305 domain-containing protein n=1 Tax=Herbaspirillum sp. GCM10030257 TaxID=3273393 RepID=UPI003612B60D